VSRPNVLDASALLALMLGERGWDVVASYITFSQINAVNLSEVVAKLVSIGSDPAKVHEYAGGTKAKVVAFDDSLAFAAGQLIKLTKAYGASFGDRACLAMARQEGLPVLTSDTDWRGLDIGVEIIFIR
jgi:ribonuclease VapC